MLKDYEINKPVLETDRLIIRTLNEADVPDLKEWLGRDEIYTYWGRKASKGEKNPELMFVDPRPWVKRKPSPDFDWGIVFKEKNKVIGMIAVFDIQNSRMGDIGYRIHPEYWNMGITTEALKEVVKFVFENTEIERLNGRADVRNIASNRVLEKCGFIKEGTIRQGKMVSVYCDYNIYGMLREDYQRSIMDYRTENLILHFVTEGDLSEVARTWPADHHPLSDTEAREAIAYMRGNHERNTKGCIRHLCLAVCRTDNPRAIMGWCGLDGSRNPAEPEIFILLDEPYRGKGYGTLCVKELLRIAAEEYALSGVHGGCAEENIASARAMEKGGMVQYDTEENGDPLFRFCAKTNGVGGNTHGRQA